MPNLGGLAKRLGISDVKLSRLIRRAPHLYRQVIIPKRDGSPRKLWIPQNDLKQAQRNLIATVFNEIELPSYLHGGISGRSIITNARSHLHKQWVVSVDLKDYFPSIHRTKLERVLERYFPVDVLNIIIRLVTHCHCLPQGAPTSPFLCNLVFLDHDKDIFSLCTKNHLTYTRYFDDITISGKHANKFLSRILEIIRQSGFRVKTEKLQKKSRKDLQMVTGLVVNGSKLELSPHTIVEVQEAVTKVAKYGFLAFKTDFPMGEVYSLQGKIAFIRKFNGRLGNQMKQKLEGALRAIDFG